VARKTFGIPEKIRLIGDLILNGLKVRENHNIITSVLRYVPSHDVLAELQAIYAAVRKAVRYTDDPVGLDSVKRYDVILVQRTGDCADMSVVTGVLLMMAGYPVRLKVVRPKGILVSHIYPLAGVPKYRPTTWIPVDPVYGRGVGKEPPSWATPCYIYDVKEKRFTQYRP